MTFWRRRARTKANKKNRERVLRGRSRRVSKRSKSKRGQFRVRNA